MRQRALDEWLFDVDGAPSVLLTGISDDSRHLRPGIAFLAYPGAHNDGREFISDAIASGVSAIIYESPYDLPACFQNEQVPILPMPKLSQYRAALAARFYDDPSRKLPLVGVTGTNGKTSCVDFIAQALSRSDKTCGVIGTLGEGVWPTLQSTGMTTPGSVSLQRGLDDLLQKGASNIAMEVSSHALALGRVEEVVFDIAVFTQLSRDHLDFHKNMEDYEQAKMSLFCHPGLRVAIVNVDDPCGRKIVQREKEHLSIVGISLQPISSSEIPMIYLTSVLTQESGFEVEVSSPWGVGQLTVPLLGKFNLYNVMSLIGVLGSWSWSWCDIVSAIEALQPVPGRMQFLGGYNQPSVVVDYAHTPDALEQVLSTLKEHGYANVHCIFGCGGDRDKGKRSMMAKVAESLADKITVTLDNPRSEDPQKIVDDIMAGFSNPLLVNKIFDRKEAISQAIHHSSVGDVILIAGKGHESIQVIGDQKLPFNDADVVKTILEQRGGCV
ncbi:MAG: UDP-N-acetylmuramoyl-L-alanyl-D-glutamate--2,6-diaminopimelate ligase [Coxiellaceae bacterium]|nr:UDP-N-acetylmuramoyl-L-alanyl-D-glutamate--2,6-diaminopimelate ligase [Coxiellaceae bacterium]